MLAVLCTGAKRAMKRAIRQCAGEGFILWEPEGHLGAASVQFEAVIAPCVSA